MTFTIVLYIILSVITDVIVFRYIGRWNRYNVFSPLRLLLFGMILLLQIPAWFTAIQSRLAFYESSVFAGLISCAIAPLLVLLGARLVGRPAVTWRQWWGQPFFYNPVHKTVALVLTGGIVFGILLQFFIVGFRDVPLFANIFRRGDIEMLSQLREHAFKYQPLYVRYGIEFSRHICVFIPLVAFVTMAIYKLGGRFWLVVVLMLGTINAGMQGAKDPPAAVIIVAFLAWVLVSGKRIRLRTVVITLAMLSMIPVFFVTAGGDLSLDAIGQAYVDLGDRLFVAPSSMVILTFAYVPDLSEGFFYGRTINLVAVVTQQPQAPLPILVYQAWTGGTGTKFANAAFYADGWANFGWIGVIVMCLLVGVFLALFERVILTSRKTLLSIACLMSMVIGVRQLLSEPFTTWVLSGVGFITLTFAFLTRQSNVSDEDMGLLEAYAEESPPSVERY